MLLDLYNLFNPNAKAYQIKVEYEIAINKKFAQTNTYD